MDNTKTWTYNLTNASLTIDPSFGLTIISIVLVSGTGTYTGSRQVGVYPSEPISLTIGLPIKITSSSNAPLGDLTLTATGVILIMGK